MTGLKSDGKHPYMKFMHPFWRYTPKGFYSEVTIEMFERRKIEFDNSCKYYQWRQK